MNYLDFKEKTKKWNQLAQVDILGSFDFCTSIITFDSLNQTDLDLLKNNFKDGIPGVVGKKLTATQYEIASKLFPLAIHEYTHFIDSTSTLWGLEHLKLMSEAYSSNNSIGGNEVDFHRAKFFQDHIRQIRLPKYYSVIETKTPYTNKWTSKTTVGRIFSAKGEITDRPVIFSRFTDEANNELARSPISTISLLESSAMAQEVMFNISLINSTKEDFKIVETENYSQKTIKHLYNHNLTEYSVCVHLVANHLNCKDIFVSFLICAKLTRITLNFPKQAFKEVETNCPIEEVINIPSGHPFGNLIKNGLKYQNRGVIFFLLCKALPVNSAEGGAQTLAGIQTALKMIGINAAKLSSQIMTEAKEIVIKTNESAISSISILAKCGFENLKKIENSDSEFALPVNLLNLPPALLADSNIWLPFSNKDNQLSGLDLDACFQELYRGQEWVDRFSEACV